MRTTSIIFLTLIALLLLGACAMPVQPTADQQSSETMPVEELAMDAPEIVPGELTIADVRANMTLPTDTGSVWLTVLNGTDTDDALLGADVPGCGVVELHNMKMENDVMVMYPVEGQRIPVPSGEVVELKKGGLHVMCMQKEAPLEAGSTLDMVLHFENAGDVPVTADVVEPGASMPMTEDEGSTGE